MDIMLLVRCVYNSLDSRLLMLKSTMQMHYSPLRSSGIGLSDGECVERLWSYLRRFSRMTKEMRPSHRIDVKRKFLLCMKAKYAGEVLMVRVLMVRVFFLYHAFYFVDGQKIAKRLSMQITKETGKIKKFIAEYNVCLCDGPELTISEVLDPQSTVFGRNASSQRRHNIIQAYLRKKRSEEEIELLQAEMEQTQQYFQQKLSIVTSACRDISASDADLFSLGAHSILTKYKWKLEQCLCKTKVSAVIVSESSGYESDSASDGDCTTDEDSDCDTY